MCLANWSANRVIQFVILCICKSVFHIWYTHYIQLSCTLCRASKVGDFHVLIAKLVSDVYVNVKKCTML